MPIARATRTSVVAALAFVIALPAGRACAQSPLAAPAAQPTGLVLVEEGAAKSVIVADPAVSPSEQWAVSELQTHLEQISGAKLGTLAPDDLPRVRLAGGMIVVGARTAAKVAPEVKLDGLGDEGFVIKVAGNRLIVAGGEKRGTLYGVYALLERLGVRWWTPTETFVPRAKTVTVPAMDLREVPRLEYRETMYGEIWSDAGRLWCARNKVNGMGGDPAPDKWGGHYYIAGLHGHNTIDLVEDEVGKGKLKPEMWALAKQRDGSTRRVQSEVCFTNPEVIAATIRSLVKLYKAHPDTAYLNVDHEDNNDYCRCPDCAAVCEREESPAGLNIQFVNALAEAVEKEVPGARLHTDAYLWTRKPPKNLRPRPNVIISFAPIEADYAHPLAAASNPENRAIKEDIEGWSRIAPKLFIWNYVGNRAHYLMPNPDFDSMVADVKFFVDNKAVGIGEQGTHVGVGTEFVSLRMWVLAKVLWNPDADGDALMAEFLNGFYGPAAPAIQKYIDVMHEYGRKNNYHLGRKTAMNVPFLQPAIVAEAEAVMREADKAAAGDATLERRVRHAHLPVWYVLAKRGPESPTWKTVEARVGKLDFAEIAARSNQTAKEWNIYAVADPEESAPWFEWLTDYAALLKKQSPVLPPELKAEDLKKCRLIQARQLDSMFFDKKGQWIRMEGASDGWVLRVLYPQWFVQHRFSPYDEYTAGKTYKLFVRVKGAQEKKEGVGLKFGLFGEGSGWPSKDVPVNELTDGKFHAIELGPFTAGKEVGLWMATSRDGSMPEVYLDCLWLQQTD